MTDATRRREQGRERARRHRSLRAKGKAAYCVGAHSRRLAEALIKPIRNASQETFYQARPYDKPVTFKTVNGLYVADDDSM